MVVWEAWDDQTGTDPFTHPTDQAGHVTHGHLKENDHHGGNKSLGVNLKKFPTCFTKKVIIGGFHFTPGDFTSTGADRCTPTVRKGHSLTFVNDDAFANGTFSLNPSHAYLGLDLPQRDLVPVPVRAEHRDLVPAGQRRRRLRFRSAGRRAARRREAELEHAEQPATGDVHVLLPDPPVHARGVPDRGLATSG